MRKHAQLVLAISMASFGAILILTAFFVPPLGMIDASVLAAFGEILILLVLIISTATKSSRKKQQQ